MTKISTRLATLGVAFAALVTACGDTVVEPTFGEGCLRGSLSANETVEGAISAASCRMTYNFWSSSNSPYESWSVHLDAGKAYMFYMQQVPDPEQDGEDGVDPLLMLYGKDDQGRSIPLALSDDDAGGTDDHDSEFWFIAPTSGDFVLVAASYDWDEFGGYRLSMQTCPILGTLDTAGTYTFPTPSSSCIRHEHPDYGEYPMTYSFLRVDAEAFEDIDIEFDHDVSTPYFEMGGPGMDTYNSIWSETEYNYSYGNESSTSVQLDEVGGIVTVAIGTEQFNAGGTYTITLDRTIITAPTPASWWDGRLTLRSTFPKSDAKKAATP